MHGRSSTLLAVFLGCLVLCNPSAFANGKKPQATERSGYVPDSHCNTCHPKQALAWLGSKHEKAMQRASPENVLGDFNRPLPENFGHNIRLTVINGEYRVSTTGADDQQREFTVSYVLGVHPLQQLLLSLPGGRLQAFTLAWDTVRHRWFDLQAEESVPAKPGESLHWSGRYQNWNLMCGECHTTDYRKGYDDTTDRYATTWVADHVGCQACHGPGQQHVVQRQAGQAAKYDPPRDGFAQVDKCASCHARRTRLVEAADPQGELLDNFQPDTLRPDLYYPDGQQLAEVFEYGSYRQSRMYQAGVACNDCHNSHSGKLHAIGNALCVRCHNPEPDPKYPGLKAKVYDSSQHHFHPANSAGSQCVDCHMPSRNYMVVHPRRDHAIRIPDPELSQRLGTPNACNQCHSERDAAWAQKAIERHFGQNPKALHYGEILAAGQHGKNLASVSQLASDRQQPAIVRASAIELLARLAPQQTPPMALRDNDPAVRSVAAMAFGSHPAEQRRLMLTPLLHDPVRAVRIAAARGLANLPESALPEKDRPAQRQGLAEFIASQKAMSDMPAAQLNLALLMADIGQPTATITHFRRALVQDPAFDAGRLNFARWLHDQKRNDDAETILREGLPNAARPSDLYQALALLLAEQGKLSEADQELAKALILQPSNTRLLQLRAVLRKKQQVPNKP